MYAITGLKLKARSPLAATINIELANGAEGYIPPPEQHLFGGYTTWPARTAGLAVEAEPRIVETLTGLLERVAGARRRREREPETSYSKAVRASTPWAYWRMDEMERGPYAGRVAYYLPGIEGRVAHSVYFAGGHRPLPELGSRYSIEAWIWPGVEKTPWFGVEIDEGTKQWHHTLLAVDGGRARLLVNGRVVSEAAKAGRRLGEGFEGRVDEVAIYRRVLGDGEMAAHRQAR
ncbi:MAG: hypothetical protein R2762_25945 [Bryobacteraceae bacterium]